MNKKILFVDDEPNLRETLKEILSLKKYDVKTASNGLEALELLEYWIPDLIISDIMMPVMDGNMLHDILKEDQLLSAIPFIFLTAKNEVNLMRDSLIDGADDLMYKPFKIKELELVVKSKIARFEKIKNAYNNLYSGKKSSFLHEINTPLSGILGLSEHLTRNVETYEKKQIHELCQLINISGKRLNRTFQNIVLYQNFKNNLLEFDVTSKAEMLKIFLKVKADILQIYEGQEARISFEVDKASVKMNAKYLHFILFELIDNALKFSSSNKIIVSGECYNETYYQLVITDFGIGISEDELKRIGAAQQFNREKMEQQGLGLGLFLSKMMIKKANGVFAIVSKVNEGTCIKIFLPLNI